jgi:hypothetical protein
MISAKCRFQDFIEAVKGENARQIILLADQEATEAERNCYRMSETDCCRQYADKLKDLICFLRYPSIPTCCIDEITEKVAFRMRHSARMA